MRNLTMTAAVGAIALASCREAVVGPANRGAPAFAMTGVAACPTPANFVVSDESGLLAALAAASAGQVIAVSGTITVTADVSITTPGITLTCASAGSGLIAGSSVAAMLNVLADRVTVERLVLGGGDAETPYYAAFVAGVRLTNNRVTCGGGECAFFRGTPGAIVADNEFVSTGSTTGVHMQEGMDSSRVERNTVTALAPSTGGPWGGLRPGDGRGVVVAHNVVRGPWMNSISLRGLFGSLVEKNDLEGPVGLGIRVTFSNNNLVRANQVIGAGSAGIELGRSCRNTFVGNNLQRNAGNLGLILDVTTGANTVVSNQNIVVDNGAFDCNGDAVDDPNIISGSGAVLHGVNLGGMVSDEVVSANRLR